jgi:hypothetical protein
LRNRAFAEKPVQVPVATLGGKVLIERPGCCSRSDRQATLQMRVVVNCVSGVVFVRPMNKASGGR